MKNKREIGITLVSLVITIIILLILAGITINQLTNSGLFSNAKLAKEKYENAEVKEDDLLKQYENAIENGEIVSDRDYETEINKLKSRIAELENKDTYDTTNAIAIGKWTDENTIYRKVLNVTSTTLTANAWTNICDVSSLNIKKLISCKAYTSIGSGEITNSGARIDSNNIQLYAHVAWSSINTLVIEYTKNED